ncbi:DNA cytosine methyltransferase [Candidatus Pacearchaeota archaeon]|nr:DNA cytosine methyltransferase [Candidatus Pacearchaeota archaeon]
MKKEEYEKRVCIECGKEISKGRTKRAITCSKICSNKRATTPSNKRKKNRRVRVATVFSGIGAIEYALKRMNIPTKIVFACDNDKFCKQSYFENYDISEDRWIEDIHDVDGKKYKGKVDLFVGGSPCQSFSMVGKRKGLEDPRGLLIYEFARLIKEIQPKVFIYENVRGIMNHGKSETWQKLKEEFESTGYDFHVGILNSKDYGIPQNRGRMFVVGFRKPIKNFKFPEPVKLKLTMQDLLEDNPNPKYFLPVKGSAFVTKEKNLKKKWTQINGEIALCQKRNQQFNWHGDFIMEFPKSKVDKKYFLSEKVAKYVASSGTKNFYSKPKFNLKVARPLLATMAKMHRAGIDNYIKKGGKIRKLTPRECLRLMGFDDRFKIVVSDTQSYKQAGNAIVVDVLINLLNSIGIENHVSE